MLMRLALVLTTEVVGPMVIEGVAAGLVEEGREDTESPGAIYILSRYNNKPLCYLVSLFG